MIVIIILYCLILSSIIVHSYVIIHNDIYRCRTSTILKMAQLRYEKNEKDLVKKSNMIFIAPMDNFSMDEAEVFKKGIPENWEYSVLTGKSMMDAIDGTPFCLLSSILAPSNFCIFVFDDDIQKSNDTLNNCINKVLKISKSRNYEYAICRKGHLIYINESEIKKKKRKPEDELTPDEKIKFSKIDEIEENEYMNQLKNLIENNS